MEIQISAVPYDSGFKATRMGRGPSHFLLHGAAWRLIEAGHQAVVRVVEAQGDFLPEIATAFSLNRLISVQVREACERGAFPLVLSGNCGSALGAVSGLGMDGLGLIWFDAHGDFNTPETTTSGFLDGMGLAAATGRCWQTLAATIPGFTPLPDNQVVHIGARDLDAQEEDLLSRSGVAVLPADRVQAEGVHQVLAPVLSGFAGIVKRLYVHIDLDVLDPLIAPANRFAPPGGLTVDQVGEAISLIRECFPVAGAGLASYDPEVDKNQRTLRAGFSLMDRLVLAAPEE